MANEDINPLVGKPQGSEDNAAKNAELAAQVAAQDAAGHSTAASPQDISDTSSALDALVAQVTKKPDDAPAVEPAKKADDAPAKTADDATKPADAPAKAAVEPAKPATDPEASKKPDDIFKDAPSLPAGASPKSAEAFASIKLRAAQEISTREAEIEKLKKQVADVEATRGKLTPEQEAALKELEDLRTWRAKLDIDFDPKFKEHDKGIEAAREFVYAQLKKHPEIVTDSVISEIKKFGGPDNTVLTKVFEAIKDPVTQRLVEAKLADIEMMKYQKNQAIQAAKENVGEWTKQREAEWQKAAVAHTQTTQTHLEAMLNNLDWFKDKQADEKADEAAKADAAEHNKFVTELRGQIKDVVRDDSPQMRAILVTGMAQLFQLQRVHAKTSAELESVKKSLAEATDKLERVKNASVNRLRESSAPATTVPPAPKQTDVNTHPGDALDALAKQVMEARAAANQ